MYANTGLWLNGGLHGILCTMTAVKVIAYVWMILLCFAENVIPLSLLAFV